MFLLLPIWGIVNFHQEGNMKTAQIMERSFMDGKVRQNHATSYFCVNDLTVIANKYRSNQGLPKAKWVKYKDAQKSKEFFKSLMSSENISDIIRVKRGRKPETWVHPLVFLDYAMWLSPDFKVAVYKWLYDNLTVFRDNSGESYKAMCITLANTQGYTPAQCGVVIPQLAKAIQRDVGCNNWNQATEEQLNKRDEIHKGMSLLLEAGVDPYKAYSTIKSKVLSKENGEQND